jgi:hypothetical protein
VLSILLFLFVFFFHLLSYQSHSICLAWPYGKGA